MLKKKFQKNSNARKNFEKISELEKFSRKNWEEDFELSTILKENFWKSFSKFWKNLEFEKFFGNLYSVKGGVSTP